MSRRPAIGNILADVQDAMFFHFAVGNTPIGLTWDWDVWNASLSLLANLLEPIQYYNSSVNWCIKWDWMFHRPLPHARIFKNSINSQVTNISIMWNVHAFRHDSAWHSVQLLSRPTLQHMRALSAWWHAHPNAITLSILNLPTMCARRKWRAISVAVASMHVCG